MIYIESRDDLVILIESLKLRKWLKAIRQRISLYKRHQTMSWKRQLIKHHKTLKSKRREGVVAAVALAEVDLQAPPEVAAGEVEQVVVACKRKG